MGDSFEESGIFDASLSMWKGLKQNKDGSFSYEEEGFEPIPLDLFTAASIGEEEIVQDLLESSTVRVNALNGGGWSALMYAAYMGHDFTVQCLMEAGADLTQRSRQGYSPLILAAMCGNDSIIHYLLQKGADSETIDKRGWSALFHAASAGHQQTTELLIKWGANCEIVEPSQGLTPLMEASASGHEIIVTQLLTKGVDTNRQDFNGDNARSLALVYGHVKIASLIEQSKSKSSKRNTQKPGANQNKSNNKNQNMNPGLSGPSIHAGPMAFAQLIGPDGKPHPNPAAPTFLQDPPQFAEAPQKPKWEGPKDLETLLRNIGCHKHMAKFADQDVDLHVFLTLSEADLKEIGIDLFGPRRKMVSAIGRARSEIQASISDTAEHVYANALNAKYNTLQAELNKLKEEKDELRAQVTSEYELRQVAEGCLMEYKDSWSLLRKYTDKCLADQHRLLQTSEQIKLQSLSLGSNEKSQSVSRTNSNHQRKKQDGLLKNIQDLDSTVHHTNDYLSKMQSLLQRSGGKALLPSASSKRSSPPV